MAFQKNLPTGLASCICAAHRVVYYFEILSILTYNINPRGGLKFHNLEGTTIAVWLIRYAHIVVKCWGFKTSSC